MRKTIVIAFLFPLLLFGQQVPLFHLVEDVDHPYFGTIQFQPTNRAAGFQGLSLENWLETLKLYPARESKNDYASLPPMLGEIILDQGTIYFSPRFPFMQGKSYQLQLDLKKGYALMNGALPEDQEAVYQQLIRIPALNVFEPTFVEKIYPSTPNWPANQLKFYIYFSAAMRFGEAFKHIHLYDENGDEVEDAFLLVEQELWDKDRQRLTVWFDPGRIKRGLIPNLEKGPPLVEGEKYALTIEKEWEDLNGQMLSKTFVKEIHIAEADRQIPNPKDWLIIQPVEGTRNPVRLIFNEPMDYALLQSAIIVVKEDGAALAGEIQANVNEEQWCFFPAHAWEAGTYNIRLSNDLEDLAGNNLIRLFDTELDLDVKKEKGALSPYIEMPFIVVEVQPKE